MLVGSIAGRLSGARPVTALILLGLALGCAPSPEGEPAGSGAPASTDETKGPQKAQDRAKRLSAPVPPPAGSSPRRDPYPMLERLGWLAGSWVGEREDRRYEEHWLPAAGGMMLGVHREVRGSLGTFEYVRIQGLPAGAVYIASPGGMPPTHFQLVESDGRRVVFENPEHGFPQQITYWIEGEELHARIQGEVEGMLEFKEWTFRRSERGLDALAPEKEKEEDDGGDR